MNRLTKTHDLYNLALRDRDMLPTIAYGTAGTGKTYGACAAAVEWLANDKHSKFLGVRPNVAFAEDTGFLPGDDREKLAPWIRPITQNLAINGIGYNEQDCLEKKGRIQYMQLAHVQGITLDNTFVILDEVQNMTFAQIKGFMTRVGKYSKVVICGDIAQVSPKFHNSGLSEYLRMIEYFDARVHVLEFTRDDVLRGDICKSQIIMFEDWEQLSNGSN